MQRLTFCRNVEERNMRHIPLLLAHSLIVLMSFVTLDVRGFGR